MMPPLKKPSVLQQLKRDGERNEWMCWTNFVEPAERLHHKTIERTREKSNEETQRDSMVRCRLEVQRRRQLRKEVAEQMRQRRSHLSEMAMEQRRLRVQKTRQLRKGNAERMRQIRNRKIEQTLENRRRNAQMVRQWRNWKSEKYEKNVERIRQLKSHIFGDTLELNVDNLKPVCNVASCNGFQHSCPGFNEKCGLLRYEEREDEAFQQRCFAFLEVVVKEEVLDED